MKIIAAALGALVAFSTDTWFQAVEAKKKKKSAPSSKGSKATSPPSPPPPPPPPPLGDPNTQSPCGVAKILQVPDFCQLSSQCAANSTLTPFCYGFNKAGSNPSDPGEHKCGRCCAGMYLTSSSLCIFPQYLPSHTDTSLFVTNS